MLKLRTFCAGKSQLLHHTKLLTQSVIERVPATVPNRPDINPK